MAISSIWNGPPYFGIDVVFLNADGTTNGVVSPVPNTSTISPMVYNPIFVPKSYSGVHNGAVIQRPTQTYVYSDKAKSLMESAYRFNNEDFTDDDLEYLIPKRFESISQSFGDLRERMDLVQTHYQIFSASRSNKSALENKNITLFAGPIYSKYYGGGNNSPYSNYNDITTIAIQDIPSVFATGLQAIVGQFGQQQSNPTVRAWNAATYENKHPRGSGNYYNYRTQTNIGTVLQQEIRYDLYMVFEPSWVDTNFNGLSLQDINYNNLTQQQLIDVLNTNQQYKPTSITITAKLQTLPPFTVTKGTFSHVRMPGVTATGDASTPSVIICHDARKIYYFLYSYTDNKRNIAYGLPANCELIDQGWYL